MKPNKDKKKMNPVLKAYTVSAVVLCIMLLVFIFIQALKTGC